MGGGPSGRSTELKSFDVNTGGLAEPANYFDKESLLTALEGESCVKKSLSPDALSKTDDMWALVDALKNSSASGCTGIPNLRAFSIVDFDSNRNLATIRLSVVDNLDTGIVTGSYFDLLVKPNEFFRTELLRVRKGFGFFQKDADKIFSFDVGR